MTQAEYQQAMLEIVKTVLANPGLNVESIVNTPDLVSDLLVQFADNLVAKVIFTSKN